MTEFFSDTYVLFVDMLGFASLVEEHGNELSQMNPVFAEAEDNSQLPAANLLADRFITFHRCLNQTRARLQELGAGTAIVFFGLRVPQNRHPRARAGYFKVPDVRIGHRLHARQDGPRYGQLPHVALLV